MARAVRGTACHRGRADPGAGAERPGAVSRPGPAGVRARQGPRGDRRQGQEEPGILAAPLLPERPDGEMPVSLVSLGESGSARCDLDLFFDRPETRTDSPRLTRLTLGPVHSPGRRSLCGDSGRHRALRNNRLY